MAKRSKLPESRYVSEIIREDGSMTPTIPYLQSGDRLESEPFYMQPPLRAGETFQVVVTEMHADATLKAKFSCEEEDIVGLKVIWPTSRLNPRATRPIQRRSRKRPA